MSVGESYEQSSSELWWIRAPRVFSRIGFLEKSMQVEPGLP